MLTTKLRAAEYPRYLLQVRENAGYVNKSLFLYGNLFVLAYAARSKVHKLHSARPLAGRPCIITNYTLNASALGPAGYLLLIIKDSVKSNLPYDRICVLETQWGNKSQTRKSHDPCLFLHLFSKYKIKNDDFYSAYC